MREIIKVNNTNVYLLQHFIDNIGTAASTFRYFNKKNIDVIKNHLVTILILNENIPVGYGHLDKDEDKVWLGICVRPDFNGQGYGKLIMNALIQSAVEMKVPEVLLSVDKVNTPAIKLYKFFGFEEVESQTTYIKFKLQL